MADLREQMLKAGLISQEQAKRSAHNQRVENKELGREGKADRERAAKAGVKAQKQARTAEDRKRGKAQREQRKGKERPRQLQQKAESALERILREGRMAKWEGNRTYYFADGRALESLKVTDEAARQLEAGKAAIVRSDGRGRYTLLLSGAALQLLEATPERIVTFHRGPTAD
ncbi:MAG: DUF2058 family protein [SAR324 cluster bacterium]|nr:DUF2058 family protein [SAR324 cluster bacterium]